MNHPGANAGDPSPSGEGAEPSSEPSATMPRRITVDKSSPLPLYHQLCESLRQWAEGVGPDRLMPSETELMKMTGVSRQTVRRAVAELVNAGVLRSEQGRGTFSARPKADTSLERLVGFTESMRAAGRRPSTRVLGLRMIEASDFLASRLEVSSRVSVWELIRLRMIDERPAMIERAHLPVERFPELNRHDLSGSLYEVMRIEYNREPYAGREIIQAINADGEMAKLLDTPMAAAIILTHRVTVDADGVPIEDTIRHARGDTCSFSIDLSRGSRLTEATVIPHAGASRP